MPGGHSPYQIARGTAVATVNSDGSISLSPSTGQAIAASGPLNVTASSATALTVAKAGTDYAFQVNTSAANAVTGLKVTSAAAGEGVALAAIGGNAAENLAVNAKGAGVVVLNSTGAGNVSVATSAIVSGNPLLYVYGYRAAVGAKYGSLQVGTDGNFNVAAEQQLQLKAANGYDMIFYNGVTEHLRLANAGNVTIAAPTSGIGLTVSGGGASITGANVLRTAATAGGAVTLTITPGAHTALTAEVLDVSLGAHSVTLTNGTTIALARSAVFGATTYAGVAAGGTETVTTAITAEFGLPVQGANLTMTNAPISARFLGNTIIGNILPPAAGPTNSLFIGSGTAPTTVVADTAAIFTKDVAADYCAPHMMVETNALALVIAGVHLKADTGDTANPYEGLLQINSFDNAVKIYADGLWRTLVSW